MNAALVGLKSLVSKRITRAAKDTWKALSMSQYGKKPYLSFTDQLGVSCTSLQIYFDATS